MDNSLDIYALSATMYIYKLINKTMQDEYESEREISRDRVEKEESERRQEKN